MAEPAAVPSSAKRQKVCFELQPDPLRKVPRSLLRNTTKAEFTVCDLLVVLSEFKRIFNVNILLNGPHEGAIELVEVPVSTWLLVRDKHHKDAGQRTELRFSANKNFKKVNDVLRWLKTPSCNDDTDTATQKIVDDMTSDALWRKYRFLGANMPVDEVLLLLKQPLPLCLRENYPYWSWPRFMFSCFEALVVQRIRATRDPCRRVPCC